MVRVAQCCTRDGVVGSTDCSVAVIQSVLFSGWAFDELSVFREFVAEITFVKVAEYDNKGIRVCSLHTQNLVGERALGLFNLWTRRHLNSDQNERREFSWREYEG